MANYIKNFVTAHGITFEVSKRNVENFEKAKAKWVEIEKELNIGPDSVVMFCGAKNNGKSSLVRYLINKFIHGDKGRIQKGEEVVDIDASSETLEQRDDDHFAYYVDYDPGQSELTTPGMVSAHIIRSKAQPLLSPTYLNVLQHEAVVNSSVGGTNMSVNPRMFIENSRYVYNKVKDHRDGQASKKPIFINTMGHIRNVGLAMLMDLIKICSPTNLVVLNVDNHPMRTIYADLGPRALENTKASFYYETSQQAKGLNYKCDVHNLDFSFTDSTVVAMKNRTALQLAYIASIPEALYKPIMQLSPKWISLKTSSIHCVSSYPLKEAIVLELLYHSWIHLVKLVRRNSSTTRNCSEMAIEARDDMICNIIDEVGENLLLGCGIVADIDLENKRLAVITPLNQETIDRDLNCVIKPLSIQVPREMMPDDPR